jgi:hypothetical protein
LIVASGNPDEVCAISASHTGQALLPVLQRARVSS